MLDFIAIALRYESILVEVYNVVSVHRALLMKKHEITNLIKRLGT